MSQIPMQQDQETKGVEKTLKTKTGVMYSYKLWAIGNVRILNFYIASATGAATIATLNTEDYPTSETNTLFVTQVSSSLSSATLKVKTNGDITISEAVTRGGSVAIWLTS